MMHYENSIEPKYSESPMHIRHHVPVEISLGIMDCMKIKLEDTGRSLQLKRKLSKNDKNNDNVKKERQIHSAILFKNKSSSQFEPINKIEPTKLFKQIIIANSQMRKLKTQVFNNEKIEGNFGPGRRSIIFHDENHQKRKIYDLSIKLRSSTKNSNEMKLQNLMSKVKKKYSLIGDMNICKGNQQQTRKNSIVFNFKRDLSSVGQNRLSKSKQSLHQNKKRQQLLEKAASLKFQDFNQSYLIKKSLDDIKIQGKRAPSSEIICYQTLLARSPSKKLDGHQTKIH